MGKSLNPSVSLAAKLELTIPEDRIYLTRAEMSCWLQIAERTLDNWARKKNHPLRRFRVGNQRLYRLDNARAYIEGGNDNG